ncbi:hypothetical protein [Aeromicrobium piscarium]|uniref:Uncharacterized protein n=1 Tax=Aeromicrobium piscarium TaxID=2590901 RepID=A0A554SH23_9ACTN|nr:hypothetical protein [Aeromicrobium piscarium]TSD65647.1 hypothetical protein FNM00_04300 [Aeromicrobium piscarium]
MAVSAYQHLLEHVGDGGLTLTGANYLKPSDVRVIADGLPSMAEWIFPITREVNVLPVHGFRVSAERLGLVRRRQGSLSLTRAGRDARNDPRLLWDRLRQRLLPTAPAFDVAAGAIVALHLATTPRFAIDSQDISHILTALGWAHAGGRPVLASDVIAVRNTLWDCVGNVGPWAGTRWERRLSQDAVSLIRDALVTQVPLEG